MVRKLIAFSFEPDSIGGFGIVCNGVHMGKNSSFSHCYPMTKAAFLEALKDRMKFNELLGIDIRDGWQNALKDAIEPFVTMTEDCDPAVAAQAVAQADINVRGEEKVSADMETLEKDNEKLVAEVEKEIKKDEKPATNVKKSRKTSKKAQKEPENDEGRKETVADSSAVSGSDASNELSTDGTSPADNA